MSRYHKADVETRFQGYDVNGWPKNPPAVNVKVYDWPSTSHFQQVANEYDDPAFAEWCEQKGEDFFWTWLDAARNDAWELLQSDAEDFFFTDHNVKVWADGRSGGWAVVEGLPDVESWDALMLNKWRAFEKFAKALAADCPRSAVDLAYMNAYEAEREECEKNERQWTADLLASLV